MPIRDAAATRRRLLDAAASEFAAHGVAGARVDRIAANAKVNKARLYDYYGDKLGLFNAVFQREADAVVEANPFDAEDLPRYALRVYDSAAGQPDLIRLLAWARLERIATETFRAGVGATGGKLAAIAEAQRAGLVTTDLRPAEVLQLTTSMALTWSAASIAHYPADDEPPAEKERRRQALLLAVTRVVRP